MPGKVQADYRDTQVEERMGLLPTQPAHGADWKLGLGELPKH